MKPPLADDVNPTDVPYPAGIQPKADGVRGMHIIGQFTGRSLDPFAGFGVTEYFSNPAFAGFDGEMVLGTDPKSLDALCNKTAGALGAFKGITKMADLHWWVFDDLRDTTIRLPYRDRYDLVAERVDRLKHDRIHLMPMEVVKDHLALSAKVMEHICLGYEGSCTRNLDAPFKPGRPNKGIWQLGRIKVWCTCEILVTKIHEGETNNNEPTINSLGKMERSSRKAGKVPNKTIGSISGPLLADLYHPITKRVMKKRGEIVKAGAGEMNASQRSLWFHNPENIIDHIATIKFLPHGMQNELRMATFKAKRLKEDMS